MACLYSLVCLSIPLIVTSFTARPPTLIFGSGPVAASINSQFQAAHSDRNDDVPSPVIEYNDFIPHPHPDLSASDVVKACMDTLVEDSNQGLETCFVFSSDRCRAAIGGSLDEFTKYARNPVFQYLVNCDNDSQWQILSTGPLIAGTQNRGAMQTVLMSASPKTVPSNLKKNSNNNRRSLRPKRPMPFPSSTFLYEESPSRVLPPDGRFSSSSQSSSSSSPTHKDDNNDTTRQFLWTLQKERRPPLQGCWLIHEVMYMNNAFSMTV